MEFKKLESQLIYQGRVFELRRDVVEYPDGRIAKFDMIHHQGAVTIVPIDDQGNIWFINQYRQGKEGMLLELPAGTLEENEDPENCASRELQEEIGMAAKQIRAIGEFYLAPGYSTEYMYIYLALGLTPSSLEQDYAEFIQVKKIAYQQAYHRLERGEYEDAKTIASLVLAKPFIDEWIK